MPGPAVVHRHDQEVGWEVVMYTFTIAGKIKPAVRMTQRSKHCDPQAADYLVSKQAINWQLLSQMADNGWDILP